MQKNKEETTELMDLVYILGTGSRWSNNEIRYSLRSAEKFFPHRNVFIIGEYPTWITGITHIFCPDRFPNKLMNARAKYLTAASDARVSKKFILMNDDFFFLRELDKIPAYKRGTLAEQIKSHHTKAGYYYQSLMDTKKKLEAMGVKIPHDYEVHSPMVFDKDDLLMVIGMIGSDKPFSLRTCYGNLMNIKAKKIADFKANNVQEFAKQVLERKECFLSINDALVVNVDFRRWIHRKFSKPSKYEGDGGKGVADMPGRNMKDIRFYATKTFYYDRKYYGPGDIIDKVHIEKIRKSPQMKGVWRMTCAKTQTESI